MTLFAAALLTVFIAFILIAGKVLEYRATSCAPAVSSRTICEAAEPTPSLNRDEGPEERSEVSQIPSPDVGAVATPTAGAPPFIDFAPMPPARMLPAINRAAVLAMMNQGSELPPGFQFTSRGVPR